MDTVAFWLRLFPAMVACKVTRQAPRPRHRAIDAVNSEPATGDQQRVWSHFQNEARDSFARSRGRLDYIARQIRRIRPFPLCVLNVGIGEGYLEDGLLKMGQRVFVLDLDPRSVERMNTRGVQAHVGRIEQMPFEAAAFDVVITSEVLEHLSEEEGRQALIEVRRVLRPNGVYVGTVPCGEDLQSSMCICPHCGLYFHRWGHQRSFTPESLKRELSSGFEVLRCFATAFPGARRSVSGLVKGVARVALARCRVAVAMPTIYWEALRHP